MSRRRPLDSRDVGTEVLLPASWAIFRSSLTTILQSESATRLRSIPGRRRGQIKFDLPASLEVE
jgi:hypothetical protein